ncbi:PEP-CTERM/exosortase system-associated acyltransferase [Alishewanella tabrizica]|uniref:Acyl-homoserine-lactone synthase n=1 Tax=Alishewanella tabrizica TaxID=671278 RepID=A0ABQ2WFW5_9ALTE|nr:PEP-CTERM/exosortase system-associated acyltransferase [Alishewanella tabrizica]GGW53051.1 hypothetical protein GCM10008111_06490 [Alishewanella tabrizica]
MYQNQQAASALFSAPEHVVYNNTIASNHWIERFTADFQVKKAINATERTKVYRLRHRVYCEELGYEPVRPEGIEYDSFDQHSIHCFLEHRNSNTIAGTLRMIECFNDSQKLPIEHYFQGQFIRSDLHPSAFAREQIFELSRLAVAAPFRKNMQSQQNPQLSHIAAVSDLDQQAHFRYISAGLYLAALEEARAMQLKHAYAAIAPALARMLNRVGFQFEQISQPIELNGKRAAYYLDIDRSLQTLCNDYQLLFKVLAAQLQQSDAPQTDTLSSI